jgi:glutaminyl-peptide cyclotransferase
MKTNRSLVRIFITSVIIAALLGGCASKPSPTAAVPTIVTGDGIFNGDTAYAHIKTQLSFGPRTPGSQGHELFVVWLEDLLTQYGWAVKTQSANVYGMDIQNIIATRGDGSPKILLGAHYDTRLEANKDGDPDNQGKPVPGANDGASGVAVLLEFARALPTEYHGSITLAFFDAEDQGGIHDLPWIIGSSYYVSSLGEKPDVAVIVDMVGDENLAIYQEQNSDPELTQSIWDTAIKLGYGSSFIPEVKFNILDDHTPFVNAGIPSVEIIDLDYPYWHTTQDTIEHVSPTSLSMVGTTLLAWLTAP